MNATLELRTQVAAHPNMIKLRLQLDALRRRLNNDYGVNFMGIEINDATDAQYERENGQEGVNRWTPVERKQWYALETRIKNLRAALIESYQNAA
jgi:type III secretory pathway component EscV